MKLTLTTAALVLTLNALAPAQDIDAMKAHGQGLIEAFGGALKTELVAAIEAGGAVNAVEVCKLRAPEIASTVSEASDGWTISRSSHRLRNPLNAPDAYTAAAIETFLSRVEAGEPAGSLAQAGIFEEGGQRVFRMVKAIPTGAVCLQCHGGEEIAPEVATVLDALYPQDRARGFGEGDMRGVFTLRKPLD
ncbi:MAG: DUF3365 domain-containing protein [Pseudomonadota bacterium]